MFFTASPTPPCCSTPDLISRSDKKSIMAEFISDDEFVTVSRYQCHRGEAGDGTPISATATLSTSATSPHSSRVLVLSYPHISYHYCCSSALSRSQTNSIPKHIAQTPTFPPAQLTNVRFPYTNFITTRCFNRSWHTIQLAGVFS